LHAGIVRGSAYTQQLARRVETLLVPFEAELAARVGIGPGRALDILKALGTAIERRINNDREQFAAAAVKRVALLKKRKATADDALEMRRLTDQLSSIIDAMGGDWVPTKTELHKYVGEITADEWSSLRSIIGLTSESRLKLSSIVEVQDQPLFFIDEE